MKKVYLIFFSFIAAAVIFFISFISSNKEKEERWVLKEESLKADVLSAQEGGSFSILPEARPEIDLYSDIAIAYDSDSKKILFEKNAFKTVPIASLTKLMTALVFLEKKPDLSSLFSIKADENVGGSTLYLYGSDLVTLKDLLYASIVGSANNATMALVRASGVEKDSFVDEMNRKAIELELESTQFKDPTGLSTENSSSAYDIARLAAEAFKNETIKTAANFNEYYLVVKNTGRGHTVKNPNKLLDEGVGVGASKTGFLYEAGYCLAAQCAKNGNIIIVVLGSETREKNFSDVKKLLGYFNNQKND